MEFVKVFWDVMTAIGCIFSILVVVTGLATLGIMGRDMLHDLISWRNQSRLEKNSSLFCDRYRSLDHPCEGTVVDVCHFDREPTAGEIMELSNG